MNETDLSMESYQSSRPKWFTKLKIILLIIFSTSLLYHLNIVNLLELKITEQISAITPRNCHPIFVNRQVSFIPPGISASEIHLPGNCTGLGNISLTFTKTQISFSGLHFSPIGLKVNTSMYFKDTPITGKWVLGFKSLIAELKVQQFSISHLAAFSESLAVVNGNATANLLTTLNYPDQFEKSSFRVDLNQLATTTMPLPMGLSLAPLDIQSATLQGEFASKGKKIEIDFGKTEGTPKGIQIGNNQADVELKAKGFLEIFPQDFLSSQVNLLTELRFKPELLESIKVLKSFLDLTLLKEGELYKGRVQGSIVMPNLSRP